MFFYLIEIIYYIYFEYFKFKIVPQSFMIISFIWIIFNNNNKKLNVRFDFALSILDNLKTYVFK